MLEFNKVIGGIHFDVKFSDKINIIRGDSGTGKTFLFNTIESFCVSNSIPYASIDYKFLASNDVDLIYTHCINKDIILLDNADLYLTPELFNKIINLNKTVIISKKSIYGLNASDIHLYSIEYTEFELKTRRLY